MNELLHLLTLMLRYRHWCVGASNSNPPTVFAFAELIISTMLPSPFSPVDCYAA